MSFSNATPAGIYFQNKVKLNPDADLVIGKDDYVILLEEENTTDFWRLLHKIRRYIP